MNPDIPFYRGPVRTLWRLFGGRRRELVTGLALRIAQSSAAAVSVLALVWIVDRLRTDTLTGDRITVAIAVVLTATAAQYGLGYAANSYAWVTTFQAIGEARIRALQHVHRLPVGSVLRRGAGDVSTTLTSDFEAVSMFVHYGLQNLVAATAQPVLVLVGLIVVDAPMAGAVAVSILLAVPLFRWANGRFKDAAVDRGDRLAAASGRMIEYVQGIGVVRAFDRTGDRLGWYGAAVRDIRRVNDALAVKLTPAALAAMGTVQLGVPLVIATAGYWWSTGRLDPGTAVVFLLVVLRVYAPLLQFAAGVEEVRLADAALERIGRIHDLPFQSFPNRPAPMGLPGVTFDEVTFGYTSDRPVVHNVSFHAAPKTLTAVVGPSGAGKSTLLNLIARFWDTDSGVVRIGGTDVRDLTAEQLFDTVTLVPQDVYLFQATVRDNITFGRPDISQADVEAAARAAQAHEFISALSDGYDTHIGEGGATLSGGERQRLSIARAILKGAPVVLLDEATAALDPINELAVQHAVAALVRDRTVIAVAHRLSTIRDADQIVVLNHGRIAETGRHDDLVAARAVYAQLWAERQRASQWRVDQNVSPMSAPAHTRTSSSASSSNR